MTDVVQMKPAHTADTMSDAIALSSPSGRMSKRARKAASERLRRALFEEGLVIPLPPQPSQVEHLRAVAAQFRELADKGMGPRKHRKAAERLEAQAQAIEEAV